MRTKRILLTVLATLVVVVSSTSLIRTVRTFYRLDFPVSWVEEGLVVQEAPSGSSAEEAGLLSGDMVVEVDGVSTDRLDEPAFMLAGGETHVLSVRHADGSVSEIPFTSPPPIINAVYLARTVVGFLGLGCALYAVWGTRRREAATFLMLAMAALIMGAVPNRIAAAELALQVIRRGAGAMLPFLIVRFFTIFPERARSMRLWDAVTVIAGVAAGSTLSPHCFAPFLWPRSSSAFPFRSGGGGQHRVRSGCGARSNGLRSGSLSV
ncbi:MAG: PDZ domain-containing protein [Acidobacteriota bacterium]